MPEFQTAYQKQRESLKPRPAQAVPSAEEHLAKLKADMEKGIENARKAQATAGTEMKESLEDAIKRMQAQTEEIDKNPQMKENYWLGAEMK